MNLQPKNTNIFFLKEMPKLTSGSLDREKSERSHWSMRTFPLRSLFNRPIKSKHFPHDPVVTWSKTQEPSKD